ncbi:MAG: ATP-binding domain-containing protein [Proteobacteria bacterium]|nr:ATP-binding domain-containing protein [Pseudomonadota bacterium]
MTQETPPASGADAGDADLKHIVAEEERVLSRVVRNLGNQLLRRASESDYDADLIALRDEIAEARLEDVPALIAQMERLQQVAARRSEVTKGWVDARSPYFGRIVLQEGERKREVLIGRGTYLDPRTGVSIVDWRDAPVSRIYYRYDEGDDYDEVFGGRRAEGEVLVRRTLAIVDGLLRRIASPQGTFARLGSGCWRRLRDVAAELGGGQGAAVRPDHHRKLGQLGVGVDGEGRIEKHLPEIAALIDPAQFDLITRPDSKLVVIQGGAGSGKTTVGLHRMAYLAFQFAKRFRADRMLVVVFNDALARYVSRVLPALGVAGVGVLTFEKWAAKQRVRNVKGLPLQYCEDTPNAVVRIKKHPAMLRIIDAYVAGHDRTVVAALHEVVAEHPAAKGALDTWMAGSGRALGQRVLAASAWLAGSGGSALPMRVRHLVDRQLARARRIAYDVPGAWSELLTDMDRLSHGFAAHAKGEFGEREMAAAVRWCTRQCWAAMSEVDSVRSHPANGESDFDLGRGVDGIEEGESPSIDREDDALLLRLAQKLRGPLRRNKEVLAYAHMFVDEAQDLSPVELAVLLDTVPRQSVTLAGDVAQRLLLDNGFSDWRGVLGDLGLSGVEVEPLKLAYRSTEEIMGFAQQVLGPLAEAQPARATRRGVPVEVFEFAHVGDTVAFLGEALRALAAREPLASVAVIAHYPEQADLYHRGLANAEVPNLRRIADQDFPFRPGVDVTDVRQVKGLEFDYVVLAEVSEVSYPVEDESRHLLHIAATRAAHQLWVCTTGRPSELLPEGLGQSGHSQDG